MIQKIKYSAQWVLPVTIGMCLLALFVFVSPSFAQINKLPEPDPIPGSYGLEATKQQDPPTVSASISTPANGASFTTSPITVNGICTNDLLVQVYNNNVMVGAVMCENNSFTIDVSLFVGTNEISAILYDSLEQPGPVSNIVTVTYNDSKLTAFGQLITLTSSYGRRSAPAGAELQWPLQLSGGTGPYAFSIDWGDGSAAELKSQPLAGLVSIAHNYKKAGIYQANVKVTDVNGVSAFLQVIAVGSGKVEAAPTTGSSTAEKIVILWIPAAVALILLLPTFWLGRRSQTISLRNKMLKDREKYEEK